MKKAITLRLCIVIILSMFIIIFLSHYLQVKSAKEAMYNNSKIIINQILQIIEKNDAEIEQLKENLKEDYFIRAKAAAYIVENRPEVISDQAELKKITELLQVDELHLFNTEGTLYAGSEPKYFNYTFNSGEQMQFFLPMLDDYSLQLCQDVTPNTAESKLMQYIAVWREDRQGIIQIGMEPLRLLAAMEKNELSHIFTLMTAEEGSTIFAANPETGVILGATDAALTGRNVADLGISLSQENLNEEGFAVEAAGEKNYCVTHRNDQILVGVSSTYQNLYQSILVNMILVCVSLCLLSAVIIILILTMLDKFIIHRIYEIIRGLKVIAAGDLDYHVEVRSMPEFVELSDNINSMVMSLLNTTNKLSLIFQNVNIQIAVFEYNPDMKRVLATSKIGDILMLPKEELLQILSDKNIFSEIIRKICDYPYDQEQDVYRLDGDTVRFVKIKSYHEGRSTWGIIVDVTEEITEKQEIKLERDIDYLTGIFSRRAFFTEMDRLFQMPEVLKTAVIMMVDLDNLKYINDNYGHEYGDELLCTAADLLKNCSAPNKVISRLGGDEFVLMVYGACSQDEIQRYLDDLYDCIQHASIHIPNSETIAVRMSGGYIFYPQFTEDYNEMLRLADQTMYQAKNNFRGHFVKYQPEVKLI